MRLRYKKIGLFGFGLRADQKNKAFELARRLSNGGAKVVVDTRLGIFAGQTKATAQAMVRKTDMLLSLGGDGTLLAAVCLAAPRGLPVLGVNLGGLGYMTAFGADQALDAAEAVLKGRLTEERRTMLYAEAWRGKTRLGERLALNDIVFARNVSGRMARLETRVNGVVVAGFKADGLIIATPTGSTAYALSVGGPIIASSTPVLLLAPISPHALSNRPLVLPDDVVIEIRVPSDGSTLSLAADGARPLTLKPDDKIAVKRATIKARLLLAPDHDPWRILREKLGWYGS